MGEAEESNNEFQNYTQEAAKQHELHSQAQELPRKRRSLPLSANLISSPALRGGKKRKLTNTKRSINTLDESDEDIEEIISNPSPPPSKQKNKKVKKKERKKNNKKPSS